MGEAQECRDWRDESLRGRLSSNEGAFLWDSSPQQKMMEPKHKKSIHLGSVWSGFTCIGWFELSSTGTRVELKSVTTRRMCQRLSTGWLCVCQGSWEQGLSEELTCHAWVMWKVLPCFCQVPTVEKYCWSYWRMLPKRSIGFWVTGQHFKLGSSSNTSKG